MSTYSSHSTYGGGGGGGGGGGVGPYSSTSSFCAAMDAMTLVFRPTSSSDKVRGENGALSISDSGVGEPILALFNALVRGCTLARLNSLIQQVLTNVKQFGRRAGAKLEADILADLFILAFQTRDCRGGKGEKSLSHDFFLQLHSINKEVVLALVPLIPEYGSWKDINVLLEKTKGMPIFADFQRRCLQLYADALISDRKELDASEAEDRKAILSLAAKYAPRKGKHFGKDGNNFIYDGVRDRLFPSSPTASADYRKLVSRLNRALDLVEVKMCDGRYSEIKFSVVPSRALDILKNAFLNMTKKDSYANSRYPDNPDRVTCRENFLQTIRDKGKTLKGGQMMPHELVRQFMSRTSPSRDVASVVQAQWDSLKAETLQSLKSSDGKPAVNLGNVVPLVDVSGSMHGTPMEVAIALGILTSEITSPAFRDRFITFEERPQWVVLEGSDSLQWKVYATKGARWGMSTNFAAAFELILSVAQKARLAPSDIPTLLVLSDMQFNMADSKYETMHERLTRRFAEVGMATVGLPYTIPQIIYWNLRGDTTNHAATADTLGVQMLSGFSPSLLKQVLNGEVQEGEDQKITPYDTLRNVLDDSRYDPVRKILKEVLPNY